MAAGRPGRSQPAPSCRPGAAGSSKKKLTAAARKLARGLPVRFVELLIDESMPSHTASLREGHDFHNQQQLESLWPGASPEIHISPRAAKLAAVVLHELRMFEYTGQLPGGASWSEQPAWRLELWQAYWQAYQAAGDWPELAYPTRDSCDD